MKNNWTILMVFLLLLVCSLSPVKAVETDDVVDVSEFPAKLAEALNVPLVAGQLLASALIMSFFLFPTMLLTHKKTRQELPVIFVGFLTLFITVALGWVSYWVIIIISFIVAIAMASELKKLLAGGG